MKEVYYDGFKMKNKKKKTIKICEVKYI